LCVSMSDCILVEIRMQKLSEMNEARENRSEGK
jgi:hypothetical protein